MHRIRNIASGVLAVLLMVVLTASTVQAAFPTREIRLVVPWGPGGATDIMARQLQPIFKERFGVTLAIINVAGGNSVVGMTEVATARPDGYTVGVASSTILALIAQGQVGWDVDRFTNLALLSEDPLLLLVRASAPWRDLRSFMEYVKQHPGEVRVGTSGSRNVNHGLAVLAAESVGSTIRHVPFDSGAVTVAALMGGHIDAAVLKPNETMSQLRSGEVRALGVFRSQRLSVLPDVPTFAEMGYDVFAKGEVAQISFLVAPAGIPADVRTRLIEMFDEAIQSPQFQAFAAQQGFVAPSVTGAELDGYVTDLMKGLRALAQTAFQQ